MKTFLKTQIISIFFGVCWILYLNVLAFLNHPTRAIMIIDWFVWGLALGLTVFYVFLIKRLIGRKWVALPLILLPYWFLYQPIFSKIQTFVGIGNQVHNEMIYFFSLITGTIMAVSPLLGLVIGMLLSKNKTQ